MARLKADELVSVGAGREVTLDHVSSHALLLADQASQGGGHQKTALGHVEILFRA